MPTRPSPPTPRRHLRRTAAVVSSSGGPGRAAAGERRLRQAPRGPRALALALSVVLLAAPVLTAPAALARPADLASSRAEATRLRTRLDDQHAALEQLVLLDGAVLAHVDRERAVHDDEDLLLDRITVPAAGRPGRMGSWRAMTVSHDLGDEERGIRFSGLVRADGATRIQARARIRTAWGWSWPRARASA